MAAIKHAKLIIVDISGKNPNCFYELGMAHTLKPKRTIMITRDCFQDVPFDVAHFRIIKYEDSIAGKSTYEDMLRQTVTSISCGLSEFYREEFETILRIISGGELESSIYTLMALGKSSALLPVKKSIQVEGYIKDPSLSSVAASASEDLLAPFLNQDYVKIIGDYFTLTDKGEAFAEYATSAGYVTARLNDEIFEHGYIPLLNRSMGKKKAKPT